MNSKSLTFLDWAFALLAWVLPAQAAPVMPSFDGAPAGWVVDRYEPDSFGDVGSYAGRDNVLAIGISSVDGLGSRPAAYQSSFYNTQGMQHAISGGMGSVLSAALYIPSSWANSQLGHVRTDMWGVMTNGTSVTDYPIIGFTNYDGAPRLRLWDDASWVDLGVAINYDDWTDLSITFTGTSYIYKVNGVEAHVDNTINGSTGFSAAIMQGYNFCGDTSLANAVCNSYTAHWSNSQEGSQVPTPASVPLVMLALMAGAYVRRYGNNKK